jgi:hypothetical protein
MILPIGNWFVVFNVETYTSNQLDVSLTDDPSVKIMVNLETK